MKFSKIVTYKLLISMIGLCLFVPFLKYQNQCLVAPCGFTYRTPIVHIWQLIPVHGINIFVLFFGFALCYLIAESLWRIFLRK